MKTQITWISKRHMALSGRLTSMIPCLLIMAACQKEEVDIVAAKPGPVPIQMHNFNSPVGGGLLDGSAPDIYYFKQKEDDSYVFMLTSTNYQGFETNWATEYVVVHADATGIIKKTEVMRLPTTVGATGTFDQVTETSPSSYVPYSNGVLYYQPDVTCSCRNRFFFLNPEVGYSTYSLFTGNVFKLMSYELGKSPVTYIGAQTFATSDGWYISVGNPFSPDIEKYSRSGNLEIKQPIPYYEAQPSFTYLTDTDGDYYFIALYNGPSLFRPANAEWFVENKAKSFFYLKESFLPYTIQNRSPLPNFDLEIRFGDGKKQKAHRFNRSMTYKDFVDVPFEAWDITNNRQLMISFRDQGEDGAFNLVPKNIDERYQLEPNQSRELIWAHDVAYLSTPDPGIISGGANNFTGTSYFNVWPYLTDGAKWNPDNLPVSSFFIKRGSRPGPQLLKVNAGGTTVVKENYDLGTVPLRNIFKAVPYGDGFAVLINAPQTPGDYQPTQLVLLDRDLNEQDVITMASSATDYGHQLEGTNYAYQVFYARLNNSTVNDGVNPGRVSLQLSLIRDNSRIDRSLDDIIPYDVEKYKMTPTSSGGVAIIAWVRPTEDTRDLVFLVFDAKLELVAGTSIN